MLEGINRKVMRRWKSSREERFGRVERPQLGELPQNPYDYGEWKVGISVPAHYHISVDHRDYSVPFQLIGKPVNCKLTAVKVELYSGSKVIAVHPRGTGDTTIGTNITNPDHMPPNHQAMARQDRSAIIASAFAYSEGFGRFVSIHLDKFGNPPATYNMLRRLLEKSSIYGKETVDNALANAVRRNEVDADTLWRLLERGIKPRLKPPPRSAPPTDGIRGPDYYSEGDENAT